MDTLVPLNSLTTEELITITKKTIHDYQRVASQFWVGTRNHDVTQNIDALLRNVLTEPPFDLLDFGCGPGRDVMTLLNLGHRVTGLEGCKAFVDMASEKTGCEVWHQDFMNLDLPARAFDGVFANASLFHVPTQELHRVLKQLWHCLRPGGVLFCSNPRGPDIEQFSNGRYGAFLEWETWRKYVLDSGFSELEHYYRPKDQPRSKQPWLASVWRRPSKNDAKTCPKT